MIQSEKQYEVTGQQKAMFEHALSRLRVELATGSAPAIHPLLGQAQQAALESQIEQFRTEMLVWENATPAYRHLCNVYADIVAGLSVEDGEALRRQFLEHLMEWEERHDATDYRPR